MNKYQRAEQMRRALQLFAGTLDEETALEIATVYPPWAPAQPYTAGEYVTYGTNSLGDPQLYKVVQSHMSQDDWTPDKTPALFTALGLNPSGYPIWSRPTGAHDAYNTGDIVSYNDTLYESLIDGNVWAPDEYPAGWKEYNNG